MASEEIPAWHCVHRRPFQTVQVQEEEELLVPDFQLALHLQVAREASTSTNTNSPVTTLYDRENERLLLEECYRKCHQRAVQVPQADLELDGASPTEASASPAPHFQEFVLITGNSGMGKTVLATSICDRVLADGGFFVSGKCGHTTTTTPQEQQQPFAPYVAALAEWVDQLDRRPPLRDRVRAKVREDRDLTAAIRALLEEVPSLESIVGAADHKDLVAEEEDPTGSLTRKKEGDVNTHFGVVFRRFLGIVCSLGGPFVLLLDDLQWAKPALFDLLESLLLSSIEGLMIIGTCRPTEVSMYGDLPKMLIRLQERGCGIVEIIPPTLGLTALACMVSDETGLPLNESTTLAQTVLHETKGNALFARQYIQSLKTDFNDGLSCQSSLSSEGTPESDMESSEERIVRWLIHQMRRLPQESQYLIQAISCLGGTFTVEVLRRASALSIETVKEFLKIALERNLILYQDETQAGRFAHDKYQEAAYSLLISTPSERALFHLRLGQNLLKASQTEGGLDEYLGTVVDLLLVGKEHLTNEAERGHLAWCCLHVGRRVALASSFAGPWAIGYMEQGIQLLGPRHWRDQYDLSLALHNAAAELAYCQGNHGRVGELVGAIKCNARSFKDQVEGYMTIMYSLGAQGDQAQALDIGFFLLEKLGYPFPRKLSWFAIQKELYKTSRMLQKFTEQQIIDLPVAENKEATMAMTVIQMVHVICSTCRPEYSILTGPRIVQITLMCGSSPNSATGFALYSLTLVRVWRLEDVTLYSQLALMLDDKHKHACREWRGVLYLALAVGPAFLNKGVHVAYELLGKAHLCCWEIGDIELGVRALMFCSIIELLFGNQLDETLRKAEDWINLCNEYSSIVTPVLMVKSAHICRILQGDTAVDTDFTSRLCAEIPNDVLLTYALLLYSAVAVYMNNLEFGATLMAEIRKRKAISSRVVPFLQMNNIFCEGILAAAMGRKDTSRLQVARRRLIKLKTLAGHNPAIFANKAYLLEAEINMCSGGKGSPLSLYDKAIELSEKNGFFHEQALACEKAGMMLLGREQRIEAESYLSKSLNLYKQWGAYAKVKQIDSILPHMERSSHATDVDSRSSKSVQVG